MPADTPPTSKTRPRLRRHARVVAVLAFAAFGLAGYVVWIHRLELFVLPARWERTLEAAGAVADLEARSADAYDELEAADEFRDAVRELIRVQRPGFPLEDASFGRFQEVRSHGGTVARMLEVRFESRYSPHGIVFDRRGRLLGEAMRLPRRRYLLGGDRPYDVLRAEEGGIGWELSVDRRGFVPHGAVRSCCDRFRSGGDPAGLPAEASVSVGIAPRVREWLEADPEPVPPPGEIGDLLASRSLGGKLRGIYQVERSGLRHLPLLEPLLADPDPVVRARAAAVYGNAPSLAAALAPRLEDRDERVRLSAAFALLRADDVAAARRGFLELLEARRSELVDPAYPLDFDVERLLSPPVIREILTCAREGEYGYSFGATLSELLRGAGPPSREALRAVLGDVTRAFREAVRRREAVQSVLGRQGRRTYFGGFESWLRGRGDAPEILAEWLVVADSPEADELLLDALEGKVAELFYVSEEVILVGLLRRETPLRGARAVEVVRGFAERAGKSGILARYLLVRWKKPGALDGLLSFLRWTGGREALLELHGIPERLVVLDDETSWEAPFWRPLLDVLPRELVDELPLEKSAGTQPRGWRRFLRAVERLREDGPLSRGR